MFSGGGIQVSADKQKEADEKRVSVWNRKAGDKGSATLSDFLAEIKENIDSKALSPKE